MYNVYIIPINRSKLNIKNPKWNNIQNKWINTSTAIIKYKTEIILPVWNFLKQYT